MSKFERRGALVPVLVFGFLTGCVDENEPEVADEEQEVIVGAFAARFDDNLRGGGVVAQGVSFSGREDMAANTTGVITIAGIPAGATVQRALLYWIISSGSDTSATVNSVAVTGAQVAAAGETCWGSGVTNRTFRADVTARITGNGAYTIGGLPSSTVATGADTDGAALVVVYQNPASGTRRRVMIRDGAITSSGVNETVSDSFPAVNAPVASTGRFHVVVGDGQAQADGNLSFNGISLGANQFPGSDGALWDVKSYNVTVPTGLATAPWTSATINPADCLVYGAAVFEHTSAVCGDGLRTGGEVCEQGNTVNGDGCSSVCDVEPGWSCTAGPPSVCTSICGDGRRVGNEQCDDGDTMGGDGCSAACTVEPGWTCVGTLPSVCTTTCGDGIRTGAEACDDGDVMSGDGCSNVCAVEPGWTCVGSPSVCTTACGDGIRTGAEACDDGDLMPGDGCNATCMVEPGWTCTGSPSACTTTCGDGIPAGGETCDDGDTMGGDGCSAVCAVEPGWMCAGVPSLCTTACGDGIIAGAEACDDGGTVGGDGCSAACAVEPGWTCTGEPSRCTTACGDGVIAGTEVCDDGDMMPGDGCSAACTVEPGWSCTGTPSTCVTTCGDGIVAGMEACDDGGTADGDGCNGTCVVEPGWTCDGTPSDCATVCGDGIVTGAELCDDGDTEDDDGCSSACALEANWRCTDTQPTTCEPLGVAGGGCSAGGGGAGAGGLALMLLAAIAGLRRRRALAVTAVLATGAGTAAAQQIDPGSTGFPVERLQMATDRAGILDVESARVPGHLVIDVGLWLGYANDPLTVRLGDEHERIASLVSDRIGGDLVGSVGIGERLQLALSAPVIVAQGQAIGGLMGEELSSFGLGDVRLTPKVALVRGGTDLAFALAITAPTSGADDYRGDKGLTAAPALLVGRRAGKVRLGANLGWRIREAKRSMDLAIDDELFGVFGAAVGVGDRAEIMTSVAFATAANAPFGDYNRNHVEGHLGGAVDLGSALRVFAAGGVGLTNGYGTADWRALVGVWVGAGKRRAIEARPVVPVVEQKPVLDLDADKDGIATPADTCPDEKETKNRFQDEDGCPDSVPDTDGDGQNDQTDSCPAVAEDADAFEDDDGCPDLDNDADMVQDLADRCVNEPGVIDNGGCPDTDRDGDAVVDRLDNCPDVPGTEKFHGCKEKQLVVISGDKIELLDVVYFKTNKAIIQKRSNKLLNNVANVVKAHPEITRVTVEGHTDDQGEDWANKDLSQRRAQAVVEYLIGKGVEPEKLTPIGYGEEKPIDDNTTRKGRAKNRRVEFKVEGIAAKVIETTEGTMAPSTLP